MLCGEGPQTLYISEILIQSLCQVTCKKRTFYGVKSQLCTFIYVFICVMINFGCQIVGLRNA
jgi:hypothetical protein